LGYGCTTTLDVAIVRWLFTLNIGPRTEIDSLSPMLEMVIVCPKSKKIVGAYVCA